MSACATCSHDQSAHGAVTGTSACGKCPCGGYRAPVEKPLTGIARLLVDGGYEPKRLCVCGCMAGTHQRLEKAPACVRCARHPELHRPESGHDCAYKAPPPDGPCCSLEHGCDRFSEAPPKTGGPGGGGGGDDPARAHTHALVAALRSLP